jgi:hypothetical protein
MLYGEKFSDRTYAALKSRMEHAETELAKLRARIVDAHRIYGFSGPDTLGIWLTYPGEPLALVKLEDGE